LIDKEKLSFSAAVRPSSRDSNLRAVAKPEEKQKTHSLLPAIMSGQISKSTLALKFMQRGTASKVTPALEEKDKGKTVTVTPNTEVVAASSTEESTLR
jgi:hypothetical protein